MNNKLEHWKTLYEDAKSKRASLDEKAKRRRELYDGTSRVKNKKTGAYADKPAYTYKNICFELVETQINNAIPQPKVTPRDPGKIDLAAMLEGYLKMEMERLDAETINDEAERDVLIEGSTWYLIGWDNTKSTPISEGELFIKHLPFESVYPQPGVTDYKKLEYIFVEELVSVKEIKKLYGVTIPEGANYKGMNTMITVYYYNEDGYMSRFAWIYDCDTIVFDEEYYELRKVKKCRKCGADFGDNDKCPECEYDGYIYETLENEVAPEDIVTWRQGGGQPQVLVKAGNKLPYYKLKCLPLVLRRNISRNGSLYGVSDIDLLEQDQESLNKLHTKMEENVMKGGSFVTVPSNVNVPNTDETLKIIKIKDPQAIKSFSVQNVQASVQQEDILQDRFYQFGRSSLGITDAYQGKRDPTAESGKAKEISAAQSSGRLESKRRMKDAAYADIYELMFKFLLAYCDERRTYSKQNPDGSVSEGYFSRYAYIDGVPGAVYYNDRFLFDVDTASVLSTNRESMWKETTQNLQAGTFGNPTDPNTLMLYWNVMRELNYPLAKTALDSLAQRNQQLPFELQQAIMRNPEILQKIQAEAVNGGKEKNVSDKE